MSAKQEPTKDEEAISHDSSSKANKREDNFSHHDDDDDDDSSKNINGVPPAMNVGRKRTIDESTLDADERQKLEVRRAYNRQCAAKGMTMESRA